MRQLNGVYTQRQNRRYNKSGHVFQGRYKAILVDKDAYLLELCRYVVLNPVRAGLVSRPDDWRWSSYRGTGGLDKSLDVLTRDWILGQFGRTRHRAEMLYRRFVKEGIRGKSPWNELTGQIFLGDKAFIEKLRGTDSDDLTEIPRCQRHATRPAIDEILSRESIVDREARKKGIYLAYVEYGYTLKQIAQHLKIHYATVIRTVKELESNNV
jgi:putative transposase